MSGWKSRWSCDRFVNPATPPATSALVVPPNVALPGLLPSGPVSGRVLTVRPREFRQSLFDYGASVLLTILVRPRGMGADGAHHVFRIITSGERDLSIGAGDGAAGVVTGIRLVVAVLDELLNQEFHGFATFQAFLDPALVVL